MTPQWKFYPESGAEPEIMPPERWAWVAIYSNGTYLEQFGQDGVFHQFREIRQDRLIAFQMIDMTGQCAPIMMHWRPGRKLIHFYRNIRLNVGTSEEVFIRLYCFGYETATDKLIVALMPDNSIRMLEDINELQVT